jgi:hypothetical protein
MADEEGVSDAPNVFVKLPDPTSGAFTEPDIRSSLKKWDLGANSNVLRFRYTKPFHAMDPEPFLRDFFNSPSVRERFEVLDAKGNWKGIGEDATSTAAAPGEGEDDAKKISKSKCVKVKHELVPCSTVSMAFFDKIYEADEPYIVREVGVATCTSFCTSRRQPVSST